MLLLLDSVNRDCGPENMFMDEYFQFNVQTHNYRLLIFESTHLAPSFRFVVILISIYFFVCVLRTAAKLICFAEAIIVCLSRFFARVKRPLLRCFTPFHLFCCLPRGRCDRRVVPARAMVSCIEQAKLDAS